MWPAGRRLLTPGLLQRKNLTSRKLSHKLKKGMQEAIQVVNFFKARALNSRLMYFNFGLEHLHLLYHLEFGWLSRGKVLQRLLE